MSQGGVLCRASLVGSVLRSRLASLCTGGLAAIVGPVDGPLHAVLDEHARRRPAVVERDLDAAVAHAEPAGEFREELGGREERGIEARQRHHRLPCIGAAARYRRVRVSGRDSASQAAIGGSRRSLRTVGA